MKTFLVGGAVRDHLLGLPVTDKDYVVIGATVDHMLSLGYQPVGKDFPVFLHPTTKEEYALARSERKSGHGYQGFVFHTDPSVTLEEDLIRRDLTINAMAMDEQGQIIDPYSGISDLNDRWLKHVSPAFTEDPLRVLRIARFYARYHALGFRIHPETEYLLRSMVQSGELAYLSPDRVWQELSKSMASSNPAAFLQALRRVGALGVLFPELNALYGVPQRPESHPEIDTGLHVEKVVMEAAKLSGDTVIRFAALFHDLGKGTTPPSEWPRHAGHEQRGVDAINQLAERYPLPRDVEALAKLVATYHSDCHNALHLSSEQQLGLLMHADAFRRPERFHAFLLVCEADHRGRPGFETEPYPQRDVFIAALTAANSVDIPSIVAEQTDGKAIARAISAARLRAIEKALLR